MRIGITGPTGLTLDQERYVADTMLFILMDSEPAVTEFNSGCAYKTDTIGVRAAIRAHVPLIRLTVPTGAWHNEELVRELLKDKNREYELVVERTQHYPYAPDAYHRRNDWTVKYSDRLVAFPPVRTEPKQVRGGPGAGTWSTIRKARKKGREVWIYPLDFTEAWFEGTTTGVLL